MQHRVQDRQLLADRLHDGPVQLLAAISLELGLLRRSVDAEQADRLASLEQRLGLCVNQLRALMRETAPSAGGVTSVEALVELCHEADIPVPSGIAVHAEADGCDPLAVAELKDLLLQLLRQVEVRAEQVEIVVSGNDLSLRLRGRGLDLDHAGEVLHGWQQLADVTESDGWLEVTFVGAAFDPKCQSLPLRLDQNGSIDVASARHAQ